MGQAWPWRLQAAGLVERGGGPASLAVALPHVDHLSGAGSEDLRCGEDVERPYATWRRGCGSMQVATGGMQARRYHGRTSPEHSSCEPPAARR